MSSRNLGGMLLLMLLAGCASQPAHYYSLLSTSVPLQQPVSPEPAGAPGYAISVQPVQVPLQVDRPQIVFTQPDSAQVIPLSSALWASPLPEQIQTALAVALSARLGALDVPASAAAYKLPLWKVNLQVHRFESVYEQRAVLDVSWQLNPVNIPAASVSLCGAQIQIPVDNTVTAMVQGHQQAIDALAGLITHQLKDQPLPPDTNLVRLKGCTSK